MQYVQEQAESRDIVNAVARSLEFRYCNEISFDTAMGALDLRPTDRGLGDQIRILQTSRRADVKIVKHFGLTFGYTALYLRLNDTVAERTFEVKQTLHGPVLGLGLYF